MGAAKKKSGGFWTKRRKDLERTGKRQCSRCKEIKDAIRFHSSQTHGYCIECYSEYGTVRNKNKVSKFSYCRKLLPRQSVGRPSCDECKNIVCAKCNITVKRAGSVRDKCKPCYQRDNALSRNFDMHESRYLEMLSNQKGRCATCATDVPGGRGKVFHIDHCHTSGRVRGLLCSSCNTTLGRFEDDPKRILRAVLYLRRFS